MSSPDSSSENPMEGKEFQNSESTKRKKNPSPYITISNKPKTGTEPSRQPINKFNRGEGNKSKKHQSTQKIASCVGIAPLPKKGDGCKGPQKTWLGASGSKANFSAPKLTPKKGAPVLNRTLCSKRGWAQESSKSMSWSFRFES